MTTSPTGLNAPPTLGGYHLTGASASEVVVRARELKTLRTAADGGTREQLAWVAAGLPLRTRKRTFTLRYAHLRNVYDLVEEILAEAGPHTLCLWRFEHLAWAGDDTTEVFRLPWQPAVHTLTPPNGQPGSRYEPAAKIGIGGSPLTCTGVDAAQFDGGSPSAGEIWFDTESPRIRLDAPLGTGETLHVRLVPLFEVVEAPENEKRLASVLREPRDLVLVET
ncbi:MAG TPA: hypothetical protein PKO05_00770 [Thermoanaerobaculia bacterium]|jgi:hypothetical protein|nr:hypothetical protein [Acidobacteriota bacterium]OQC41347.1 MAG: hypothetical protein BWX64_00973 [Acidobacteria bacterium ADurb.Bin051]HNU81949.1 hypothetical protein [Thermoanaerobaculia bacterium]HPA96836.1 hypothetical protein [Thermoanaerobaculia bacterium]HQP92492.1 hypothetical protein [Thermoanaerobaculia bacterium]